MAEITATVKDVDGNVVPEGERVKFFLNDQNMGELETTEAATNELGEAKVKFRGSTKGGLVEITAMWNDDVEGTETLVIQPPPASIRMVEDTSDFPNPNPKSINIKGTGGQSTSQISFDVKDSEGKPVADGYRIDLVILSGPDGGEVISPITATTFTYTPDEITYEPNDYCLGCCSGHSGVVCTDDGVVRCGDGSALDDECKSKGCKCERSNTGNDMPGRVSTVLRSGFKPGPVSIKATYHYDSNVTTATSQIAIEAGPPVGEEFGISARNVNIGGLGVNNSIEVSVGDFWGNAIPDNTAISFKTYNTGGLAEPGSAVTQGGQAETSLLSTPSPVPMQGVVSVTAEAINGGRTTHVTSLSVVPETEHNQILYAGTDGGGVYKSMNSGASWENISRSSSVQGQNWIDPYVNDVAADPDNANTIYAATGYLGEGKIYRSLDGGLNWNSNTPEEWNGIFNSLAAILTVLCDDDGADGPDDRYVWIGTQGYGTYFASDGKNFQWGDVIEPLEPTELNTAGNYTNSQNKGKGYMIEPTLSASSRSDTWTVTYHWDADYDPPRFDWEVKSDRNGVQRLKAFNDEPYSSDNNEVSFTIVERGASRSFEENDTFSFKVTESGLGYGAYVQDFVKVNGTHRDSAVLYAGTSTNVFKSTDGGRAWSKQGSFTGDYITVLALHPNATGGENDILYAGTKSAGTWVSNDSGTTWTAHTSGMGRGLSASAPLMGRDNEGLGVVKDNKVTVLPGCLSETWTVTCTEEKPRGGIFSVEGTVSGTQAASYDISTGSYTIPNVLSFTIIDGTINDISGEGGFKLGDMFTFRTTRDPGRHIRDLLVDQGNNLLYAVSYFMGTKEPHPVGNIYVHDLEPDGRMAPGDWREANRGLPEFDPPDDTTLFAQHIIAPDVPENPTALYVGGEGINFFKALTGLETGDPLWQESKTGLSNVIMARMPILFSGECTMEVTPDIPIEEFSQNDTVTFTIYIQDENGNPPVEGSELLVVKDYGSPVGIIKLFREQYPDTYTYDGTWKDPSDPSTNRPFVFSITVDTTVIFTFTPICGAEAPGCSGLEQSYSYY